MVGVAGSAVPVMLTLTGAAPSLVRVSVALNVPASVGWKLTATAAPAADSTADTSLLSMLKAPFSSLRARVTLSVRYLPFSVKVCVASVVA